MQWLAIEWGLQTRERILAATLDVLSEEGLDSTTLKSITDRAGVGAGSFYNLFASKEEAVWEILSNAIAAVDPDPQGLGSETSADLVNAFVQFVTGDDAVLSRIYLQLASTALTDEDIAARMRRAQQRRVDRFHAALGREHPDIDDHVIAMHAELLVAALTGLTVRQGYDASFDFATHARLLDTDPATTAAGLASP